MNWCNLGIWYSSKPLADKEAAIIYKDIVNGKTDQLEQAEGIKAFLQEIKLVYPDDLPDEQIDESPWEGAIDNFSDRHILLTFDPNKYDAVIILVSKVASKFGLVCFNPEDGKLCYYNEKVEKANVLKNRNENDFIINVKKAIEKELLSSGWEKKQDTFFIKLNDAMEGVVNFSERKGIWFEVSPFIEIYHNKIDRIVMDLRNSKGHTRTVGTNVGYLLPFFKGYYSWRFSFGKEYEPKVKRMVWIINTFGKRFIKQNTALKSLCKSMKEHNGNDFNKYYLPVAYYLLGDLNKAKTIIDEESKRLSKTSPPAADQYREFKTKFFEMIKCNN